MISLEAARQLIHSHVLPLLAEEVSLNGAYGRVLAAPVLADAFYPSGDRATMDGYVIRGEEGPGKFRLAGEIPAGALPDRPLLRGQAMRIFTGALLPPGGGRVVMQEAVSREGGDFVSIPTFSDHLCIRPTGSEAIPGQVVLPEGAVLGPAELAILAQVGAVRLPVVARPVIHHLANGNELVPPHETPLPGQIRDTNSTLLHGLLTSLHLSLTSSRHASDDPEDLTQAADSECDLLLISGGASVGDHDHGAATLRRLGFTIHFNQVNLRPGKPLTFATRGRQIAFVIPGNPVSHFVCFHVAIRLALELLTGVTPGWHFLNLALSDPARIIRVNPRDTFWPGRVVPQEGQLAFAPLRWSTSGDTFSLAGVNALARVSGDFAAGVHLPTLMLQS